MSKSYWRFLGTYGAGRTFSPGVGSAKETLTLKFLALAPPTHQWVQPKSEAARPNFAPKKKLAPLRSPKRSCGEACFTLEKSDVRSRKKVGAFKVPKTILWRGLFHLRKIGCSISPIFHSPKLGISHWNWSRRGGFSDENLAQAKTSRIFHSPRLGISHSKCPRP